jgi:hypothetical protein
MMPESIPKSIPPKHACSFYVLAPNQIDILHKTTDRASQGKNPPSINLLRIISHRLIMDDLLK